MSAGREHLDHSSQNSSAATAAEPFEIAALLRRCMDDHELAARLIEKFTGRLADTVQEIERGVESKDWSSVTSRLHNLKGEAGSLAAVELASIAEELREGLFDGHIHAANAHLLELKAAANRCIQFRSTIAERLEQAAAAALHG
jgi:HPt (histidine-containing phosphotransfer) domain-containing protein